MMSLRRGNLVLTIIFLVAAGLLFVPALLDKLNQRNWLSRTDPMSGATFKYPENISTKYLSLLDWPPMVRVLGDSWSCVEAGAETERAGRTNLRQVGGREYCVTTIVEGAAGSVYTQYAYSTEMDDRTVILTLSTRYPQCVNYSDPEGLECEAELRENNIDDLVDEIVDTLEINN